MCCRIQTTFYLFSVAETSLPSIFHSLLFGMRMMENSYRRKIHTRTEENHMTVKRKSDAATARIVDIASSSSPIIHSTRQKTFVHFTFMLKKPFSKFVITDDLIQWCEHHHINAIKAIEMLTIGNGVVIFLFISIYRWYPWTFRMSCGSVHVKANWVSKYHPFGCVDCVYVWFSSPKNGWKSPPAVVSPLASFLPFLHVQPFRRLEFPFRVTASFSLRTNVPFSSLPVNSCTVPGSMNVVMCVTCRWIKWRNKQKNRWYGK